MKIIARLALLVYISCIGGTFNTIQACSCASTPTFCENFYGIDGQVISGKVLAIATLKSKDESFAYFQIEAIMHGPAVEENTLIVDGRSIGSCNFSISKFQNDHTYLLQYNPKGKNYPVSLVSCGWTYLSIENGMVVGMIAPNVKRVRIENLHKIKPCNFIDRNRVVESFQIFPSPALHTLNLQYSGDLIKSAVFNWYLYDTSGKLLARKEDISLINGESDKIDITGLTGGVYILMIQTITGVSAIRFVKI